MGPSKIIIGRWQHMPLIEGKEEKRELYGLFFLFVIGACIVIIALLFITTRTSLMRQKQFITHLLTEKGEALIKAYEAGARAVAVKRWSPFEMQKLVIELATQPGVDYMIIVDNHGLVIADSEPFRIGGYYGYDLGPALTTREIRTRRVKNISGADTFEVYRRLNTITPTGAPPIPAAVTMFVGLDMGPILQAHREEVRRTVYLSMILLLVGITGITALFLTYRYRMTRSSLRQLQLLSHYLIEHLPVGVMVITPEGHIALINNTALHLLHLTGQHVSGKAVPEVFPPALMHIWRNLEPSGRIEDREVEWDGRVNELIATSLEDGSIVLILRDLTEIKNLREELERSRRLAAIGTLAAGVAHEIRNPLSSIKGFATYFWEKFRNNATDAEAARIIISEIDRLNRVITQLLYLARPPLLHRAPANLDRIVSETVTMVADAYKEKGVILEHFVQGITAYCDPDQLKQVLINLLLNALAATKAGDTVSIRGENHPDGRTVITVTDTGHGIPHEDLPRIFDPFFTTKPAGTGLGLAVVQRIIEAHGGEVEVTSAPGHGTQVRVILPPKGSGGE